MIQEAKRYMTRSGHRDADRLEELVCAGAPALRDSKGAQNDGDQGDECDRIGAQNSSVKNLTSFFQDFNSIPADKKDLAMPRERTG